MPWNLNLKISYCLRVFIIIFTEKYASIRSIELWSETTLLSHKIIALLRDTILKCILSKHLLNYFKCNITLYVPSFLLLTNTFKVICPSNSSTCSITFYDNRVLISIPIESRIKSETWSLLILNSYSPPSGGRTLTFVKPHILGLVKRSTCHNRGLFSPLEKCQDCFLTPIIQIIYL